MQNESKWICCPQCGSKTRVKVYEETVLIKFPLYCPKCKKEYWVNTPFNNHDEALPEKASYILNIGKVDLLPSKKTLTVAEVNLLIERKDDCLAKLLAPLRADYDYILVDTGPSLGSLTINAFTAADEIIIPVDPELFALVGLKELTETISKIKQNLNPKVEIIGILFTKCSKRTTLYRQTSEQVRSVFGHLPIFESQIPATVQVGTANSKGLSVMELDAKSPAAAAYMNLAKEVLAYA